MIEPIFPEFKELKIICNYSASPKPVG